MLPKDVRIVDLGSDNWSRLLNLVSDLAGRVAPRVDKGPLLVVYRGLKCLRAIDLARGRPVEVDFVGASRLEALSAESGYPVVVAVEETALSRIIGHAQREINYDDDYFRQWSAFAKGLAREWRRTVFTHPPGPARLPVVPHGVIDRAVSLLIPDNSLIFLVVTENARAWTSAVLGYRNGDFWLLSSLDAISSEEADVTDAQLETAVEMLGSRFGGTVRALVVEREALIRVFESRFPAGALLWARNTSELRTVNIPWRWKVVALAAAFVAGRRIGVRS